jgi:hypothetical protein
MVAHLDTFVQRIGQILLAAGINPESCRIAGVFAVSGVLKDLVCGDIFDPGGLLVTVERRPFGDRAGDPCGDGPPAAFPGVVFIGFPEGVDGTPEFLMLGREVV